MIDRMGGEPEPDFGATPNTTYLVEDQTGGRAAAHYHDGVWWAGHAPEKPDDPCRVQLDHCPVRIVPDGEALDEEQPEPITAGTLFDATLSISGMWPLPQPKVPSELMSVLGIRDELPWPLEKLCKRYGWSDDEIEDLLDGESAKGREAWESLCQSMVARGHQGWVIAVETPCHEPYGNRNATMYSWGSCWTEVLFGENVEDAIRQGIAWAEKREAEDKAKARASKAEEPTHG